MSAFSGVEAVVFDVDGTLLHTHDPNSVRGATAIPGAVEAIERVRASGRPILFFTNGTGRPPADYAADLRTVGFTLTDEEFMNPAVVAARWIDAPSRLDRARTRCARGRRAAERARHRGDRELRASRRRRRPRRLGPGADVRRPPRGVRFRLGGRSAPRHVDGPHVLRQRRSRPRLVGAVVAGIRQTTGRRP